MAAVQAERISEDQLPGTLVAEWEALHERMTPRLPFNTPLWNITWWKHYRSDRPALRDELFLLAVRDGSGSLIAVAPMMSTERPSVGPIRMRTLQCLGADPNITEVRGILCLPEHEVDALLALRRYLLKAGHRWDWIDWGAFRQENWRCAASVLPQGVCPRSVDVHDYHLALPATWAELRASRSRNVKESIRKCYNSLKRDGLAPELRVLRSPAQALTGLETFFRLHSARSNCGTGVMHADAFHTPNSREFLRYYAIEMAARDQLRIFQLALAGEVVATRIGFQFGDQLYLFYSGYEPTFGKYSVMTTLLVEALKWSIDQRLSIVNLSTGTDVSKLRWSPAETRFRTLTEVRSSWRSMVSFGAFRRAKDLSMLPGVGLITAFVRR